MVIFVCMVERILKLWKTQCENEREQQGGMRALRADTKRPPPCAGLYTNLHGKHMNLRPEYVARTFEHGRLCSVRMCKIMTNWKEGKA